MAKENLFIDTSIFVYENFLEGERIKTILDLSAKGHFKIFLSEITVNEIKARFKKQATIAFDKHSEFIRDKGRTSNVHVLRNISEGNSIIKRLPSVKKLCEDFNTLLDGRLKFAKATILPYPTIDISEIFEKYFANEPPFGNGDKKHEFPDAFALAHIEQWSTHKKRSIVFLTKDNDFSQRDHEYIKIVNDHEKFLADKLKAIFQEQRLKRLDKLYGVNSDRIDKEIISWLEEEFDDDSVFEKATNWLDINDKLVENVKVISKEYDLIGGDEENLEIEIQAVVSYTVNLNIPDENTGTYDHEDGVMLFRETTDIRIEQNDLLVPLRLNFNILSEEDYDSYYEVISINNDKALKIDPEGYDDYY